MKTGGLSFAAFYISHTVSAVACAFILSWIFGGLTPAIAVVSLGYSLIRAASFSKSLRSSLEWRAPGRVRPWWLEEIVLLGFIVFAAWKHFAWLMPVVPTGGMPAVTTLSLTNYGDLALHINQIREIALGADFPLVNPSFSSEVLRYPFGPNLYSALWERLGIATSGHLFVTGLLATVSSLVLLRELGGVWAMAAFFLAGGLVAGPSAVDWKNLFLSVWITQRGMLFALPIGLLLILFLRPQISGRLGLRQKAVGGLGRIWGFLPLFHAHAFLTISGLLFCLVGFDRCLASASHQSSERRGWKGVLKFFSIFFYRNRAFWWAFLPACYFVFYSTDKFSRASVVRLHWIWTRTSNDPGLDLATWGWQNFGVPVAVVLLFILAVIPFLRRLSQPQSFQLKRLFPFWFEEALYFGVFFLGLIVILAPWEWDNIKILVWPWILCFGLVGKKLLEIAEAFGEDEKGRLRFYISRLISVVGVLVAFHLGGTILQHSWEKPQQTSVSLWPIGQLAYAETVLMRIPSSAVFAAAPTANHPLAFWGRKRVMGYPGHLWSHGIDYGKVQSDLSSFMRGEEDWVEKAKVLKFSHVYWGPDERAEWGAARKPWQDRLTLVAHSGDHEIYEFREAK